jgi:hypothetical protein
MASWRSVLGVERYLSFQYGPAGVDQAGGTAPVILGAILYSANIFLVMTFTLSINILARLIGARRSTQKRVIAFIALATRVAALLLLLLVSLGYCC